jgi:hypothetical protein
MITKKLKKPIINLSLDLSGFLALLLLFFFWYLICFRVLNGSASLVTPYDVFDQSVMWLNKVFEAARNNELVYWDFTTQSGISFLGELQTSALYPPALIFGKYFSIKNYDAFVALHYLLGSVGAYYLGRTLKLNVFAALIVGILFAYEGAFSNRSLGQPNLFCSLAYIPFITIGFINCINKVSLRLKITYGILASLSMSFSFLAGHTHALIVGIFVSALLAPSLYVIENGYSSASFSFFKKLVFSYFLIFLISFLMVLPQFIATAEYMRLAYKWYGEGFTKFPHNVPIDVILASGMHLSDLKSFFIPGVGLGSRTTDGIELFLTYPGIFLLIFSLPFLFFSKFRFYKKLFFVLILICFLMIIFAFGYIYPHLPVLDNIRIAPRWGFGISLLTSLIVGLAYNFIYKSFDGVISSKKLFILSICVILTFLISAKSNFRNYIERPSWENNEATQVLKSDVVLFMQSRMRQEKNLFRFFSQRELYPPNLGNFDFNTSANGYRSSRTTLYHDNFDYDPTSEKARKFSVKYWITKENKEGVKLIWHNSDVKVYEAPGTLPVLWYVADKHEMAAEVKSVYWGVNKVTFILAKKIAGEIFFAQPYYPGFKAYSGLDSFVISKNQNLMSIKVLSPIDRVTFEYKPWWLYPTLFISLITMLGSLAFFIIVFIEKLLSKK